MICPFKAASIDRLPTMCQTRNRSRNESRKISTTQRHSYTWKLVFLFSNNSTPSTHVWLNSYNSCGCWKKSIFLFNLILLMCEKQPETCKWWSLFNLFYTSWDCVWIPASKILHFVTLFLVSKWTSFRGRFCTPRSYLQFEAHVSFGSWYSSPGIGQVGSNFLSIPTAQQEAVNFQAHIALISVGPIIFQYSVGSSCQGL